MLKALNKLDRKTRETAFEKLSFLANDPMIGKPLRYKLKGFRRLRIGKYRIIYTIKEKEKLIFVVALDHRKKVYR